MGVAGLQFFDLFITTPYRGLARHYPDLVMLNLQEETKQWGGGLKVMTYS